MNKNRINEVGKTLFLIQFSLKCTNNKVNIYVTTKYYQEIHCQNLRTLYSPSKLYPLSTPKAATTCIIITTDYFLCILNFILIEM